MSNQPFAVSLLIGSRNPKGQNIIIGCDDVVIRALSEKFGIEIKIFNKEYPASFSYLNSEADIPIHLQDSVSKWLNPPLRDPNLLAYLVSNMLPDMPKDELNSYVYRLSKSKVGYRNFSSLYWSILSHEEEKGKKEVKEQGEMEDKPKMNKGSKQHKQAKQPMIVNKWSKEPWEDPFEWYRGVDIPLRLSWLYTTLAGAAYARYGNKANLDQLGISNKRQESLKRLDLNTITAYQTFLELSKWKKKKQSPEQTAIVITNIWRNQWEDQRK